MPRKLVPYTEENVKKAVARVLKDPSSVRLPAPNVLTHLNPINTLARAILTKIDVMTESGRTLSFLGNMCNASSLTPKQHKWLTDLQRKHLSNEQLDEDADDELASSLRA